MRARPELRASYHPEALEADVRYYRKIDRENGGGTLAADFLATVVGADWKIASAPHRWAPYLYETRRLLLPRRWPTIGEGRATGAIDSETKANPAFRGPR